MALSSGESEYVCMVIKWEPGKNCLLRSLPRVICDEWAAHVARQLPSVIGFDCFRARLPIMHENAKMRNIADCVVWSLLLSQSPFFVSPVPILLGQRHLCESRINIELMTKICEYGH